MANKQGTIQLGIGFKVDKSGLIQLENSLKEFSKLSATEIQKMNPALSMDDAMKVMQKLRKSVEELQGAFGKAFDSRIGVLNIEKLQNSFKKLDLNRIYKDFSAIGEKGHAAFLQISQSALTTNIKLKETNSLMSKMGTTLINTLKWTFSSSLINRFTGAIQQAVGYVEHLDSSLNDIRIVTKKSADEMEIFGQRANEAAKALGKATTDYTEAALIYYQQGLSDEEVKARAETTLKAANVTGQATKTVSEQLTSVWNGFKVGAEQTEEYVDKLAAVAAMSASNLEELSTGMSKVASAASNLGVDIDQLTAQISTIVSVTRQAPESVGTALKTIYARISDLKLGESDEDGLGLGDVSGGLQKLGINVLDAQGELRDLGTVIEEVAAKWNTWTSAQQAAIAQLMAGKRQYNNLVALFSNWDMYTNAIETSRNATGELQKQQDIYMESTEAQLQQLKTQWENLYDSLLDADAIKTIVNMGEGLLSVLIRIIDTIGGGKTVITGLIGFILNKFSPQITSQIFAPMIKNMINAKTNAAALNQVMENTARAMAQSQAAQQGWGSKAAAEMAEANIQMRQYWDYMSAEEINQAMEMTRQIGYWADQTQQIEEAGQAVDAFIQKTASATEKKAMGTPETAGIFATGSAQQNAALKHLKKYKDKVDSVKNSYNELNKVYNSFNNNIQKTKKSGDITASTKKNINETKESLKTLKDKIDELRNADLIDPNIAQTAQNRIDTIIQRLEQIKKKPGSAQQILRQEDLDGLNGLMNIISQLEPELAAYFNTISNGAEKLENARNATKRFKDSLGEDELKLRKKIQDITQFVGGITQAIFLLQSASGALDTLFDKSIDGGEKFKNIVSSLIIVIPSLISLLGTLNKLASESNGGFMSFFTMGKVGIILAIAAAIMVVVKAVIALRQADFEEQAEQTKNLAEASKEAAEEAKEHKKAIDELKTSYEALDKTSITYRDDLRKLLIEHGKFSEAAQVATSSLAELDEMIKQLQEDANNKVIDTTTEQVERLKNAISADINAKVLSETERDSEISQKTGQKRDTIDLGGDTDVSEIQGILDQYGIDSSFGTGHIDLEQFVNAMVENEAALRKALQENNSDAARRLLEIMGSEQEMLTTTAEALTAKQEAQLSNIQNSVDISADGTFDEYDKAFDELKQKASGIFKDDKKAEEWAKKRIAESGTVGTAYASLTDEVKDIVRGIDKELTTSQLNYLNEHIDLYKAYGNNSAEAFLEGAREVIDGQGKSNLLVSVSIGLSKDELTDEDITSLFANGPLGNLIEGEFKLFDAQKQKRELRKYFDELIEEQEIYNKETVTKQIQSLEEQKQAQEKAYNEIIDIAKKYHIDEEHLERVQKDNFIGHVEAKKAILVENYQQQQELINNSEKMLQDDPNLTTEISNDLKEAIQQAKQRQQQDVEEIQKLNDRIDASKELQGVNLEILKQYEATTQELEKQKAAIMANSKELASSIQDIELLEKAYKAGELTDTDYSERYKQLDRQRDIEGLDTEELEDYTKYLQETAKASDKLDNSLEENGDAADIVAKSIMKMNKAVETLSSNFEEWNDILRNSSKDSKEYADAIAGMRKAVSQLLDIAEDYVSSNFLNENLELIGQAAEGDAEAIDNLRRALSEDVVMNLKLNDESFRDDLLSSVESWQAQLDNEHLLVGATFDDKPMIDAMNEMIAAAGLTVDQVNALFDSMGFEANFESQPQLVDQVSPTTVTETTISGYTEGDYYRPGSDKAEHWKMPITRTNTYQDGYKTYRGYVTAMAMTTDGSAPKIKSITKKASGAMNNHSSSNAGGKKSSGGGGGGGSKGKEPSKEKPIERDTDIYRVVNQELANIESALGRIDKINSHRWGASYKKNLEQQNKLLNQQLSKLKEKNKLQVDDLATRRKQLEKEGVIFSEDGSVLQNGEEILNKLYAEYNEMVNQYNEMSADRQESFKADMETKKNYIDALEKKMSEYESGYADMLSNVNEQLDTHYQIIENQVSHFNAEVEVKLELKDAEKEWNDFWKEVIEDVKDTDFGGQIAASMKQLNTLIGVDSGFAGSTGDILVNHIHDTIVEVDKMLASAGEEGLFQDDIKAAKENLETYRDQLMSTLREAKEEIDNIAENYIKQLEYSWELIDKQVERFEALGKHLNHNLELIKLIDGEKAFDAIDTQYENQYENNLELLNTLRQSKDIVEQRMKDQKALMEQYEEGTIEREPAAEAYEKSVDEYLKITEKLDSTLEDTLNAIKEQTENANAKILDTLDKAMSDGLGTDLLAENWKLINDYASKYYDNVERYLNMSEYENVLGEAANAIGTSAANQQKLNEFREQELKQLNEKERLTEYDIAESRARLEILKAQIALEDAQANKSKLRLRRDSQGNYNYQYVADEDQVNKNQQDLLNAQKNWYQIWKNQLIQGSNDLIETRELLSKKMSELADAEAVGDQRRIQEIKNEISFLTEELEWQQKHATKVTQDGMDGIAQYFSQVENASILPQSEATIRKIVNDWTGDSEESFTGAVIKAVQDLDAAQQKFREQTDAALTAAGTDYTELKENNIDPVLDSLKDLTDKELFDKLEDINDELKEQWENLVKGAEAYRAFKEKAVAELNAVIEKLKALAEQINNMPTYDSGISSASSASDIDYASGSSPSSGDSSSGGGNGSGGGIKSGGGNTDADTNHPYMKITNFAGKPSQVTIYSNSGKLVSGPQAVDTNNIDAIKRQAKISQNYTQNKDGYSKLQGAMLFKYGYNQPKEYWTLRSGGYTGSWGDSSGRWALLHQKELVLNENDTKNMLSAVQILRSIPYSVIAQSLINSSTNTASALSGINSGISGLAAAATNNESKTMVVNADFSGVHDADEIYQALLELENYGLQNSYSVAPHANSMY